MCVCVFSKNHTNLGKQKYANVFFSPKLSHFLPEQQIFVSVFIQKYSKLAVRFHDCADAQKKRHNDKPTKIGYNF